MRFFKILPTNPYLKFIIISLVLMFVFDQFVFGGKRSYIEKIKRDYYAEQAEKQQLIEAKLPPKVVFPEGAEYFEAPSEGELSVVEMTVEEIMPNDPTAQEKLAGAELTGIEIVEEKAGDKPLLIEESSEYSSFMIPQPDVLAGKPATTKIVTADEFDRLAPELYSVILPKTKPAVPADAPRGEAFYTADVKQPMHARSFHGGRPQIAIVIDDMGVNMKQSRSALQLPSAVTLAFLPYADGARTLSAEAQREGHETIVHIPMEAIDSKVNLGGLALRSGMSDEEFIQEFDKIANSFEGYVGMNNHMGSRLTQDREAMNVLMAELKKRNLYFLDSKTIHTSIADEVAGVYGVPHTQRDIFLDHDASTRAVRKSLAKLERRAFKHGRAVAIGHPKAVTMKELEAWIPTLEEKGIELVPVSHLTTMTVAQKFEPVKIELEKIEPREISKRIVIEPEPIAINKATKHRVGAISGEVSNTLSDYSPASFSIERIESTLQPLE